jgi:branched-chain amino acid transport system ATP-binding protein
MSTDVRPTEGPATTTVVASVIMLFWAVPNAVIALGLITVSFTEEYSSWATATTVFIVGAAWLAFAVWLGYVGVGLLRRVQAVLDLALITVSVLAAITVFASAIALFEQGIFGAIGPLIGLALNVITFRLLGAESTRNDFRITEVDVVRRTPEEIKTALAAVSAEPHAPKPDPILVADGVVKTFGGLTAVDVDRLEVERGSITALIGPNGAGKTTLFNVLTGFGDPDRGQWLFDGEDLSRRRPHEFPRVGMVRTFQLTKALSRLTVLENMKLAAPAQAGENFVRAVVPPVWNGEESEIERRADALLERFRMDHMRDEYAGTLSGGQRKLLEMARALMTEPRLVMLDEPMAGVNPALTQSLLEHIKEMRADGVTVVFVEHDMDVVSSISDWVVVMAEGRIIAESPPEQVGSNRAVIDAYLGSHHDAPITLAEEERVLEEVEAAIEEEAQAEEAD